MIKNLLLPRTRILFISLVLIFLFLPVVSADVIIGTTEVSGVVIGFDGSTSTASSTASIISYGEMWNYSSGQSLKVIDLTDAGQYHNVTGLVVGDLNGVIFTDDTSANGGSKLTTTVSGTYEVNMQISFEATAAGGLYGFSLGHNSDQNTHRECYARKQGTGVADVVSISCIMTLTAGDYVSLMVEDEQDPVKDIYVHTINVNLNRIDD